MAKPGVVAALVCAAAVWAGAVGAQRAEAPEFLNLPLWPGSAEAARKVTGHSVFRDASGEIVVSYPDPLRPGHDTTFRFWLQNRVEPVVRVVVRRTGAGDYRYEYTLANGRGARTRIQGWSVVAPPSAEIRASGEGWFANNAYQSVGAQQALLVGAADGVFLGWFEEKADGVAPGGSASGFRIECAFRPGLTTAYFSGAEKPIRPVSELTDEAEAQIIALEVPRVMWRTELTIGPRYAAGASRAEILREYLRDINGAVASGALDRKSAFVAGLRDEIARAISEGRDAVEAPKARPAGGIETELAAALEVALEPR